jgi:hypothetical protein
MKRKKSTNQPSDWKNRRQALAVAEALTTKASALATIRAQETKTGRETVLKAGLFFEAAARAFERGRLGLMSRQSWASAKDCYLRVEHAAGAARCARRQEQIAVLWEIDEGPRPNSP